MQDEILGVMTGGERAFLNEILHRYEVDALLFSAGGNDLLGPDLGALLQPFRSGMTAADAVVEGRLGRRLRQIEDCYREPVDMVLDDGADLKVPVNPYDLPVPANSFDVVVIHQVLHFLDDGGRAIREAARVLAPSGRLVVIDFAPHDLEFLREEHAHRRLGFADETVTQWMSAAGLDAQSHQSLTPEPGSDGKIAVSIWLARDPRILMAKSAREVA